MLVVVVGGVKDEVHVVDSGITVEAVDVDGSTCIIELELVNKVVDSGMIVEAVDVDGFTDVGCIIELEIV